MIIELAKRWTLNDFPIKTCCVVHFCKKKGTVNIRLLSSLLHVCLPLCQQDRIESINFRPKLIKVKVIIVNKTNNLVK